MPSDVSSLGMSRRAVIAYGLTGERPLDEWDRDMIADGVSSACSRMGVTYDARLLDGMGVKELRDMFLRNSSRHHVSGRLTEFYGIGIRSVYDVFGRHDASARVRLDGMVDDENARQREIAYGYESVGSLTSEMREELHRKYEAEHGFPANSVSAYMLSHPELCDMCTNVIGQRTVSIPVGHGKRHVCPLFLATRKFVVGFDATRGELDAWDGKRKELTDAYGVDPIDIDDAMSVMDDVRSEYERAHGFPSRSVCAYASMYPYRVSKFVDDDGSRKVDVKVGASGVFVCLESRMRDRFIDGFDAARGRIGARLHASGIV